MVSYGYWQREFAGNPNIVGTTIRVGQEVFQILGVAPPGFRGAAEAAINTTFQQTLRSWAAALPTERERRNMLNEKIELRPGSRGASALRGEFSDPLLLLMSMVGVVLLIACANIANLMLARASGRQREIGVRLALGAARRRLVRQLLTESLLVAAMGGVLGIFLSAIGTRLLLALVLSCVSSSGRGCVQRSRASLVTRALNAGHKQRVIIQIGDDSCASSAHASGFALLAAGVDA